MNYVEEISLDELKVLQDWKAAVGGTLLQTTVPGITGPVVGARVSMDVANGTVEGIVIVAGANCGKFVGSSELVGEPVIDVSELVEIVAVDAAPRVRGMGYLVPGMLCQEDGSPMLYLWFGALTGQASGYFCLKSSNPTQVGAFRKGLADILVIADSVSIRLRNSDD